MNKISLLLFVVLLNCFNEVFAQDMFECKRLTYDSAQNGFASWSPDGKSIAFTSTRSGNFDIWIMELDVEQLKKELMKLMNEKVLD